MQPTNSKHDDGVAHFGLGVDAVMVDDEFEDEGSLEAGERIGQDARSAWTNQHATDDDDVLNQPGRLNGKGNAPLSTALRHGGVSKEHGESHVHFDEAASPTEPVERDLPGHLGYGEYDVPRVLSNVMQDGMAGYDQDSDFASQPGHGMEFGGRMASSRYDGAGDDDDWGGASDDHFGKGTGTLQSSAARGLGVGDLVQAADETISSMGVGTPRMQPRGRRSKSRTPKSARRQIMRMGAGLDVE